MENNKQFYEDFQLEVEELEEGAFNKDRIRMLVYGESGIGKTRFSSTWEKPFFLDIDDGLASVDVPVARTRITHWSQLWNAYYFLESGAHPYKTIVIDSLNEAQHLALRNTVESFPNIRRSYESLASMSDYGKMLSDFDDLLRFYKALPYNLVVIAQVQSKLQETDVVMPQLIGKNSSRAVCRMMDLVGYLYRDADNLVMNFKAADYVTKDRSGKLPAMLLNPTYAAMRSYWK